MDPQGVQHAPPPRAPSDAPKALDLATAYAELQDLILQGPDVIEFLRELAVLAAAIVPGSHCGITLRRDKQVASVTGSDPVAMRMDEGQYLRGHGPCLEAMNTSRRVDVPDMNAETRWNDYRTYALEQGIHSVVALPLVVVGEGIGALNLFAPGVRAFNETDIERARAFANQAATALTILLRQASLINLDEHLREAMTTRSVIDQAIGVVMHAQKVSGLAAFQSLRHASQTRNLKLSAVAAETIHSLTGYAHTPPRPLAAR